MEKEHGEPMPVTMSLPRQMLRFCYLLAAIVFIIALHFAYTIIGPYTTKHHRISDVLNRKPHLHAYQIHLVTTTDRRTTRHVSLPVSLPVSTKSPPRPTESSPIFTKGVLQSVPDVFRFAEKRVNLAQSKVPQNVVNVLSAGLTRKQYANLIDLFYVFDAVTKKHNITYFLFSGSLLGSWRCHCLLQWDDDMDLMVHIKDRPRLLNALRKLAPKYTAVDHKDTIIKFYNTADSSSIPAASWRWPFIDVSFCREDGEYIRETNPWWKHQAHSRSDMFPLHYRPFEGLQVLAPKNPLPILKHQYGNIDKCATQSYSHRTESRDKKEAGVTCNEMRPYHPLVKRTPTKNGYLEILMMGDREMHRKNVNFDK